LALGSGLPDRPKQAINPSLVADADAGPIALIMQDVIDEAGRCHPMDKTADATVRRELTKAGLKAYYKQVKFPQMGLVRFVLNRAAIVEIEKRFECAFVAADGSFAANGTEPWQELEKEIANYIRWIRQTLNEVLSF
jgi:hypothetical protein